MNFLMNEEWLQRIYPGKKIHRAWTLIIYLNSPFRATQIWNDVIFHLKTHVEVKRRRHNLRHYNNCFTGADAVDVVLHYLLSDQENFNNNLSREKATKLCQTLMDKNVFEPASSRVSEIKKIFEDSHGKLYHFSSCHGNKKDVEQPSDVEEEGESELLGRCDTVDAEETDDEVFQSKVEEMRINPDIEPDLIGEDVICNPLATNKRGQILQELFDIRKSIKRKSGSVTSERCTRSKRQKLCNSVKEEKIQEELSPEELEDVWKEVSLFQLLTLVELPFLDGVLEDKQNKKNLKHSHSNLILSNVVAKHWNMPFFGTEGVSDPYMRAALDCIDCLSNGPSTQEREFFKNSCLEAKVKAYHAISEHYGPNSEPLLPNRFVDLHLAILNLVLQERDVSAVEALQLDMILMPRHVRENLQRLLKFMAAAAEDNELQLDIQEDNETVILNTFADVILKHKLLAHNLAVVLVTFLMHHVDEIFTVPDHIREKVDVRVQQIKCGEFSPSRDITFCNQITYGEYRQQSEECTREGLIDMMNGVLDDTKMPLKEKKQRLRQFQKYHPHLYSKHFSGMV